MKSLLHVLTVLLLSPCLLFGQNSEIKRPIIDSLKQVINNSKNDTTIVKAWEYWAGLLMESDLELHEEINLRVDSISSIYLNQNLSEKENEFYKDSKADALSNLGRLYSNRGDYSIAIAYLSESLQINEKKNDQDGIAFNLDKIAAIYRVLGDYDKALDNYARILEINEALDEKFLVANALNNIGNVYYDQEKDDTALTYYERALVISREADNLQSEAISLLNIANINNVKGNKLEAINGYKACLAIQEKIEDKVGATITFINISDTYFDINEFSLGIKYGKKAVTNSQEMEDVYLLMYSYNFLSSSYEKAGKYKDALETHKLFVETKDSLKSEENQKAVIRQQFAYEYEKQTAADSIKTAEEAKVQKALLDAEQAKNIQQKQQANFLYTGLILTVLFGGFIFNRFQKTRKQKGIIEDQKLQVDQAFNQLENKNKEIMDSINYAKRIQTAILPPAKTVKEHLKDSFILYKPKDVVAGDFYWLESTNNKVLFAAADCTGHGVPGAMVSVVCNGALNRAVREFGLTDPGEILDKTREIVLEEFEKSEEEVKDGMDIAFCSLSGNHLTYAGAHNPLWIMRNGEIIETKADKQPIGKFDHPTPYTTHHFDLEYGDIIYIFSDGYADQFGGVKGKKFKLKALRNLLLKIQGQTMEDQQKSIDQAFETWKGDMEQIDDVCFIGVRIS